MNHVFVCFGSISIWAAAQVIRRRQLDPERIRVFSTSSVQSEWFPKGTRIFVMAPNPASLNEWEKPFALARFTRECIDELNALRTDVVFYAPHVFELPANVLYRAPRVVRCELLPDGLINYVPRHVVPEGLAKKAGYAVRVSLRKTAARLEGFDYESFLSGDITQYERGIWQCTWSFEPKAMVTKSGQVLQLELGESKRAEPRIEGDCLFIDQELREIADRSLETRLRKTCTRILREGCSMVKYKAHPRGVDRETQLRDSGLSVSTARQGLAEHVALGDGVSCAVGFYSTALLHLSGTGIRRIAVMPRETSRGARRPTFLLKVREALLDSGAELVDVE